MKAARAPPRSRPPAPSQRHRAHPRAASRTVRAPLGPGVPMELSPRPALPLHIAPKGLGSVDARGGHTEKGERRAGDRWCHQHHTPRSQFCLCAFPITPKKRHSHPAGVSVSRKLSPAQTSRPGSSGGGTRGTLWELCFCRWLCAHSDPERSDIAVHHTGCTGGGLSCSGSTKWGHCLLLSHRCWSAKHPQGKGCCADIQPPHAKINILLSAKAHVFLSLLPLLIF